jgi:hypothetical protein
VVGTRDVESAPTKPPAKRDVGDGIDAEREAGQEELDHHRYASRGRRSETVNIDERRAR